MFMAYDFDLFDTYRRNYTRNVGRHSYCAVDHLLRFWKDNKNLYLTKLFGDELILEKRFTYKRSKQEITSLMDNLLENSHSFAHTLRKRLCDVLDVDEFKWGRYDDTPNERVIMFVQSVLRDVTYLAENRIFGVREYITDNKKSQYIIDFGNGKKVAVADGMKTTRFLGQLAKALDMETEWEAIRREHAQITSENKINGSMCLSIHPLDFATASDNENGWSSCMSWMDEGCYRMGTVEMMNSPMVICAYMKSDVAEMKISGETWNSKKWRAWIIVTPNIIICNKQYPIHNAELGKFAVDWVKDLVHDAYGWEYGETVEDVFDEARIARISFDFRTQYMYDDIERNGNLIVGCFNPALENTLEVEELHGASTVKFSDYVKQRVLPHYDDVTGDQDGTVEHVRILYSGPAECMVCGNRVYDGEVDSDRLECANCYEEYVCSECGEHLTEEDVYEYNGSYYCESCYNELFSECTNCGCVEPKDDMLEPDILVDRPFAEKWIEKARKEYPDNATILNVVAHYKRTYRQNLHLRDIGDDYVALCDECMRRKHIYVNDCGYVDPHQTKWEDYVKTYFLYGHLFLDMPQPWIVRDYGIQVVKEANEFLTRFFKAMWENYTKLFDKDEYLH